jgi:hypothetical protein
VKWGGVKKKSEQRVEYDGGEVYDPTLEASLDNKPDR